MVERGEHDLLMYPSEVMPGLTNASLKSDANVVSGDVKALASEIRRVEREYTAAVKVTMTIEITYRGSQATGIEHFLH